MLMLPPSVRLLVSMAPTDMRKSFDGLAAAAEHGLGGDPLSGHLFIFFNRRRDICKVLWFGGGGFNLYAKRLERGRFAQPRVPSPEARHAELDSAELALILEGIDLIDTRRRERWRPGAGNRFGGRR